MTVVSPNRAPASQVSCGAMAGPGPGDQDEHYDFLFKLVLVGDASVGKTCVVQRFKTGAFSARQGSTIGVDFTMKTLEIQGKRVKVGGGAGRCFAPGGRFLASSSASPSFGTGLGLDVLTGFRSESTALGSGSGDSRRLEPGGGSLLPCSRRLLQNNLRWKATCRPVRERRACRDRPFAARPSGEHSARLTTSP